MPEKDENEQVDQRHFVLSEEQWCAFTEALEEPARRIPQLEELLREPSVLERGRPACSEFKIPE